MLTISMLAVIAILMGTTTYLDVRRAKGIYEAELKQRGLQQTETLSDILADAIYPFDFDEIKDISLLSVSNPQVQFVQVFDDLGRILTHFSSLNADGRVDKHAPAADEAPDDLVTAMMAMSGSEVARNDEILEVVAPIRVGRDVIGGVRIGYDATGVNKEIRDLAIQRVWQSLLLLAAGAVVSYFLARRIVKPLKRLVTASQKVAGGDLELAPESPRADEIGELSAAFQSMTQSLKRSRDRLQSQAEVLVTTNEQLKSEVVERKSAELLVQASNDELHLAQRDLEKRVKQRTSELVRVNRSLQAEMEERARAKREIDSVYSLSPDILCILDFDGKLRRVNPAFAEFVGLPEFALEGRTLASFAHPDDIWDVTASLTDLSDGTDLVEFENRWRDRGGDYRWVAWKAVAVQDDQLIYAAARDITDRVSVDRMKDEFISVISHELRTPLTAIRGSLGLIAGDALGEIPQAVREMMEVAVVNSDRLIRLINDILDVRKMEAGELSLEIVETDFEEILSRVVQEMTPLANESGVNLSANRFSGRVRVDPDRIIQTLTNLVSNAVKFSAAGGTVRLDAADLGAVLQVTVSDEGRGIPEDKLEVIFDKFRQLDASDSRQNGGTGLGLAISKNIIERHGGRIWAENRPEGGATLTFALPTECAEGRPGQGSTQSQSRVGVET